MSESEWLGLTNPNALLTFLLWQGRLSDRKRRLFACACCRPFLSLATDRRPSAALEAAEQHADGAASEETLRLARQAARSARRAQPGWSPAWGACWLAEVAASEQAYCTAPAEAAKLSARLGPGRVPMAEPPALCSLLRDVAGNPFRPSRLDPAWLAWQDGIVPRLARSIYDERAFDRVPILADALEEAGCTDAGLLAHLRRDLHHTRGCWAVDALLGNR
jgi:hypothetical protein